MMDFGPQAEVRQSKQPKLKPKNVLFILIIVLVLVVVIWWFFFRSSNPLPADIKNQINYQAVYPSSKTGSLDQRGYQYQADQKTLSFTVNSKNGDLVFAESPAPSSLGSGNQVDFAAIGLHPYAQFQSKLGPVALVKFFQSGNLKPTGQSAVLVSNNTLVIAHSDKNLTNEQWKDLINSLKVT